MRWVTSVGWTSASRMRPSKWRLSVRTCSTRREHEVELAEVQRGALAAEHGDRGGVAAQAVEQEPAERRVQLVERAGSSGRAGRGGRPRRGGSRSPRRAANDASACTDEQHSISVSGWRAHASRAAVVSIVCAASGPTDPRALEADHGVGLQQVGQRRRDVADLVVGGVAQPAEQPLVGRRRSRRLERRVLA